MSRALFLSILLHTLAIALVFVIFNNSATYPTQNAKKISLSTVVIVKHKAESTKHKAHKLPTTKKAQSLELRAKSKIEKAQSQKPKAQKIKKVIKISKKPIARKQKAESGKHKAERKKLKVRSSKLKAKSRKQKAESIKKAKKKKLKVKGLRHKTHKTINNKKAKSHFKKQKTKGVKQKTHQIPISNYKSLIYRAINSAQVYPRLAKKMHQQGKVYTCFTVNTDRTVSNITTSGASSILQKAARQTINRAKQHFPSVPSAMDLCVTISYILE